MTVDQQPIACTLTAGDLLDRLAWIATLNRDALRGYDRAGAASGIVTRIVSKTLGDMPLRNRHQECAMARATMSAADVTAG